MADSSPSKATYYKAAAALMVLLAATVGVWLLPLGPLGLPAALTIAFLKAIIIALVFMHVGYGSRLTRLFAAAGLFWLLILFVLTFSDYLTRQ